MNIPKHDWEAIENAFEMGVDVDTISLKYKVAKKTLQNRIYSKKLKVKKGNINEVTTELGQSLGQLSGIGIDDPILDGIVADKISTVLEDNDLIMNNRKLAKLAQQILYEHRKEFDSKTIRNLTGAIKDIESIANPQQSSDTNIETNVVTGIRLIDA